MQHNNECKVSDDHHHHHEPVPSFQPSTPPHGPISRQIQGTRTHRCPHGDVYRFPRMDCLWLANHSHDNTLLDGINPSNGFVAVDRTEGESKI